MADLGEDPYPSEGEARAALELLMVKIRKEGGGADLVCSDDGPAKYRTRYSCLLPIPPVGREP
jgi:hypothetical protein